jgi:hypothetical protein
MTRMCKVFLFFTVLALSALAPGAAHAYPWMISHGYTGCAPCHTDPSGAGVLSAYGRAQGDLLLRSHYEKKRACPSAEADSSTEAAQSAGFLWGAIDLPEALRLGGDLRGAILSSKQDQGALSQRYILMRSDLFGDLKLGGFRAAASLGYSNVGALDAAITRETKDNLISREHWLGLELDADASWLLRAGRMALPFGLRTVEHSLWVRSTTRTDLLDDQQHGVALSISKEGFRAEIMGILGNYQLRPDDYRERGYSAYVEFAPSTRVALGASSLFTRARRDIDFRVTDYRQAHGLFVRAVATPGLVVLAEADFTYHSLTWNGHRSGGAALLQTDWEPRQGLHLMLTGEAKNEGGEGEPNSYGAWLSAVWFFASHADVRVDNIYQRLGRSTGSADSIALLAQLHIFL